MCSFGKKGINLFGNLKDESHMSIIPSNSNTFFMPNTKSTLSCIFDTNVNTSNLCLYTPIITGITNNTATYYPLPTWTLCIDKANFGNAWSELHHI